MDKLDRKLFEDVVVFSFSEPGAMGPNDMRFYKSNGETFEVDYKSEETPYSMIKELFPVLRDCYWDGPMRKEAAASRTIVIGGSPDDRETCVADGWRHIYLDYGNHIAVKKELYYAVKDIFYGKDNCNITFRWSDMLTDASFAKKIDEHIKAYYEQEEKEVRMTYGMLKKVFEENHIPEDAILMSDSGWESDPAHMNCIFYNKEANVVVFTQDSKYECDYEEEPWQLLYESNLCEELGISKERKQEIDNILKETEQKYKNGEIQSISLAEFEKYLDEKRKELISKISEDGK